MAAALSWQITIPNCPLAPSSFRGLLDHLATLTGDRIRYHHTHIEIDKLTDPTPDQRRAFDLIDSPIPLTIAA